MIQLLRSNPGLLAWVGIFTIASFVCALIGLCMTRSGLSLRPIWWFVGFLLLIGLPQFLFHLFTARSAQQVEQPRVAALQSLAAKDAGAVKLLFGRDADADLVQDARPLFGDALEKAELARFAALPTGESVLLAHFGSHGQAEKAWVAYLRVTGLNQAGGKGDSERGYAVSRSAGERVYAVPFANMLGVWTGPDDATIRSRMAAGGFKPHRRAPLDGRDAATSNVADVPANNPGGKLPSSSAGRMPGTTTTFGLLAAGGLVAYLLIVVLYFFKGAAWAGSSPAMPGVRPVAATELAARLESINSLDVPFHIERGARDGELIATWRYADAKWIDLARVHGLRRVHRIKLLLDADGRTVRATDFAASHDWSAGPDGANVQWKASTGITFFQHEHRRVFGLQLDEQGRFKPELSYAYTFNLQEMKQPLITAVTQAGWAWRPVAWQGPKWLRWLTE